MLKTPTPYEIERNDTMFESFYGKPIMSIHAFGKDEYDFTRDLCCHISFSIGEYGYFEIRFANGSLFITTDGIAENCPIRENANPLAIRDYLSEYFVGAELREIYVNDDGSYLICFLSRDRLALDCRLAKNEGYTDRDYMEVDEQKPYFFPLFVPAGKLKTCRKCGGQGDFGIDFVDDYSVECRNCGASTRAYYSEDEAIKAWNNGELMEEKA